MCAGVQQRSTASPPGSRATQLMRLFAMLQGSERAGVQVHRLGILAAEHGILCAARLLTAAVASAAVPQPHMLALLRCLHPQLHLASLQVGACADSLLARCTTGTCALSGGSTAQIGHRCPARLIQATQAFASAPEPHALPRLCCVLRFEISGSSTAAVTLCSAVRQQIQALLPGSSRTTCVAPPKCSCAAGS